MRSPSKTCIFFYNPQFSDFDPIDYAELIRYAMTFPNVSRIWKYHDFIWNEQNLTDKIEANGIDHLIVAGLLPGTVKTLFSKAMAIAGKDPANVILASFNDYYTGTTFDMDRLKSVLACLIAGLSYETVAIPDENPVNPATLVIGGGIAGIQASLEIAYSNNHVYLVEKTGTIGGKMATFDKTFPTLDCAACILTPKMVEVNQNPFINLMTYCEVQEVSGEAGNYSVRDRKSVV